MIPWDEALWGKTRARPEPGTPRQDPTRTSRRTHQRGAPSAAFIPQQWNAGVPWERRGLGVPTPPATLHTPLHIRHPRMELGADPAAPYPAESRPGVGVPQISGWHCLGSSPPSWILRQCRERISGDRNGTGSMCGLRGTWDLPPSLGGRKAGLVGELPPPQSLGLGTRGIHPGTNPRSSLRSTHRVQPQRAMIHRGDPQGLGRDHQTAGEGGKDPPPKDHPISARRFGDQCGGRLQGSGRRESGREGLPGDPPSPRRGGGGGVPSPADWSPG